MIRACTVSDILHERRSHIIDEYAAESQISGLPHCTAQLETYLKLEFAGLIRCYGAFNGDDLIGFGVVMTSTLPHYGVPVSVVESIFVSKPFRKKGYGTKLIRQIETDAGMNGNAGLLISAPSRGALSKILPLLGYDHTNNVFFKKARHE